MVEHPEAQGAQPRGLRPQTQQHLEETESLWQPNTDQCPGGSLLPICTPPPPTLASHALCNASCGPHEMPVDRLDNPSRATHQP